MNGDDILNGMNSADPELIDVSYKKPAASGKKRLRWIAAAAVAVLVLGGVTVGAVSYSGGRFSKILSGTHGFNAEFEIKRFPWDEFKGGIAEASDIIIGQYATFTPAPALSSVAVAPGSYLRSFRTFKEAAEYVGLEELKDVGSPFSENYIVDMYGDPNGKISYVTIHSKHVVNPNDPSTGDFGGSMTVTILTEYNNSATVNSGGDWGDYDPGTIEYNEFTTKSGVLCQYAEVGVSDRARALISGYVVDSGILYSLNINFYPEDHDTALLMLKDWAARF